LTFWDVRRTKPCQSADKAPENTEDVGKKGEKNVEAMSRLADDPLFRVHAAVNHGKDFRKTTFFLDR